MKGVTVETKDTLTVVTYTASQGAGPQRSPHGCPAVSAGEADRRSVNPRPTASSSSSSSSSSRRVLFFAPPVRIPDKRRETNSDSWNVSVTQPEGTENEPLQGWNGFSAERRWMSCSGCTVTIVFPPSASRCVTSPRRWPVDNCTKPPLDAFT